MESIEIDVAENVKQDLYNNSSYNQLECHHKIPFSLIPHYSTSRFDEDSMVSWLQLTGLKTLKKFYFPAALVSLDKQHLSEPLNTFPWSSNGLASGITRLDAILSGLYEVIERDAWTCWEYFSRIHSFPLYSTELSTIRIDSTQNIINQIKRAGMDLIINPLQTDIGIPVYRCLLLNSSDQAGAISLGFGCHHNNEIAINRAITEAAQARAVYISGARDDIVIHSIMKSDEFDSEKFKENFIPEKFKSECAEILDPEFAVEDLIKRFDTLGMHEPIIFDFEDPGPFAVVRVICPSLAPSGGRKGHAHSNHPRIKGFEPRITGVGFLFVK